MQITQAEGFACRSFLLMSAATTIGVALGAPVVTMWKTLSLAVALTVCLLGRGDPAAAQSQSGVDTDTQVGVSAVVRGQVQLSRGQNVVGRRVASGEPIFLEDEIASGKRSGMQILLMDETVFTIGPDSELTIDEFVYDPATDAGKIVASVTKGVFRFITGKIAKRKPDDMTVKLPVGTIGIRGTIVGGVVTPDATEVVLLGPGAVNNAGETVGRINVTNDLGSVTIGRPGYATTLVPGAPPTPPKLLPPARVQQITSELSEEGDSESNEGGESQSNADEGAGTGVEGSADADGEGTQSGDGGGSDDPQLLEQAEVLSGQQVAVSFQNAVEVGEIVARTQEIEEEEEEDPGVESLIAGVTNTISQLDTQTGSFHFFQSTVALPGGGSYDVQLDLNFASRTIGGGSSSVSINSTTFGTGSFSLLSNSFDSGVDGLAVFDSQSNITFNCSTFGAGGCTGAFKGTLQNANGNIAGELAHEVTIHETSNATNTETGSGTAGRFNGLSGS